MTDPSPKTPIKMFRVSSIPEAGVTAMFGKTGAGKTTLLVHCLNAIKHMVGMVVVFSGSPDTRLALEGHIPSQYIHDGYKPKVLERLIQKSFEQHKKYLERKKTNPKAKKTKAILVMFDDMVFDLKKISKCPHFRRLCIASRHGNIRPWWLAHEATHFPADLRGQVGTIIVAASDDAYGERMYDFYKAPMKKGQFLEKYAQIAQGRRFMVMPRGHRPSRAVEDNLFWIQATPGQDFKVCPRSKLWDMHRLVRTAKLKKGAPLSKTGKGTGGSGVRCVV